MSDFKFKPLIKLVNEDGYLPFKSSSTAQDLSNLKRYLPKSYKCSGVVDEDNMISQLGREQLLKYKLKAIKSDNKATYLSQDLIEVLEWSACICLQVPFNSRGQAEDIQLSIDEKVSAYLSQQFRLFSKSTKQMLLQPKQQINLHDVDLYFPILKLKSKILDNAIKQISIQLPIAITLIKNKHYTVKDIHSLITTDVENSLTLMVKHNLNTRILKISAINHGLVLQNYCQEKDRLQEVQKLDEVLKRLQNNDKSSKMNRKTQEMTKNNVNSSQPKAKTDAKQTILMVFVVIGLFLLAIGYFYAKLSGEEKETLEL